MAAWVSAADWVSVLAEWGWVWILVAVLGTLAVGLFAALAAAYRSPRRGVEVTQTSLDAFSFEMLHSRQPVLVAEPIAALADVLRAWFGWNVVGETIPVGPLGSTPPFRNASKYLVVHAAGVGKSAVELRNPAHPDSVLRVLVPPSAVLMVPVGWDVLEAPEGGTLTPVDDPVTWLLRFLA